MMRKTRKTVSILLLLLMLIQIVPMGASAGKLEVYWGQDYPYDDESPSPCTVMFYHEAGVSNYEFTLYKDNKSVYSVRIEEGMTNGSWWEEEAVFLTEFAKNGSGSYHFTVSSLEGGGWDIDEAKIIETKTSGKFNYTQPKTKLAVPTITSNKDGEVAWKGDSNSVHYVIDTFVEYTNGETYDPDYVPGFYWEQDFYSFEHDLKDTLQWLEEYDAKRFPYNQATVKIKVRAVPEDVRDYQPGDYTDWIVVKKAGGGTTPEPEEPKPVDRSSVDKKYYDGAKLVYDLGIMPAVYTNPKKEITRGDFAVALTALLGLKETAKGLEDTKVFSDVEAGTELNGCINAIYYERLLSGYSSTSFQPDTAISCTDICKVLVTALGYKEAAESYGGYPSGYIRTAHSIGVMDGVTADTSAPVTAEQLAQILANASEINLMEQTQWVAGYGAVYEKTDKTLLLNSMGLEKYTVTVSFASNNTKAKVTGKVYNKNNLKGIATEKTMSIQDIDILNYKNKDMKLYVLNGTILCGFELYDANVVLNKGEKTTQNPGVSLEFDVYGYTKYKMNDGEYKPIPKGTEYWMTDGKDGSKSVSFTFATEDESRTKTKNYSITLNNKHTVTYMVNEEVYQTQSVGYGKSISAPNVTTLGNRFGGWIGLPDTMPNYDITVSALVLPEEKTYTGTVVYKDQPIQYATVLKNGSYLAMTDEQGNFSFTAPQGEMMVTAAYENMNQTFSFDGTETNLGTLTLTDISTAVMGAIPMKDVEGLEQLITDADRNYVATEGNTVSVHFSSGYAPSDTEMDTYQTANYPQYQEIVETDITLYKSIKGTTEKIEPINETDSLIAITIPIPAQKMGMVEYKVLRKHEDQIETLTETPNEDGEYIVVKEDSVTVYANKFSAYTLIGIKAHPQLYITTVKEQNSSVQVDVIFPEKESESAILYVAFYGESGELLKAVTKKDFSESNLLESVSGTKEIKAFVWDEQLIPLN